MLPDVILVHYLLMAWSMNLPKNLVISGFSSCLTLSGSALLGGKGSLFLEAPFFRSRMPPANKGLLLRISFSCNTLTSSIQKSNFSFNWDHQNRQQSRSQTNRRFKTACFVFIIIIVMLIFALKLFIWLRYFVLFLSNHLTKLWFSYKRSPLKL